MLAFALAVALSAAPIRVGLAVGADSAPVGGPAGLVAEGTGGDPLVVLAGASIVLAPAETGVDLRLDGLVRRAAAWTIRPHAGETLVVGATAYRGAIEVLRDETGVTVVNVLPLEEYLRGVVPREMPVADSHLEALRAQAVAARTYALAHRGRRAGLGFDLWASVEDQVYGGASAETILADLAVASTDGVVLLHGETLVRAYYHAACGGHTASIAEAWGETAPPPYLGGVADLDESGVPWCAAAPRLAWTETYPVLLVEVLDRSPSGRVARLAIGDTVVKGDAIRRAVRRPGGGILRSSRFEIVRRDGVVVLEGSGLGHGVGLCQWGAIGQARRGVPYDEILLRYYPGARLDTFSDEGER